MLIIFTGNGKGKTTAALGQALRAIGNKKKVLMVQFIKGPWKSGEDNSYRKLSPYFKIVKKGKGFVGICGDALPLSAHKRAANEALIYSTKEALKKKWHIIILDEIWNALNLKLLSEKEISVFILKSLPKLEHLILTGRGCPQKFIKKADLVTEMREITHPFTKRKKAIRGVEF